MSDQTLLPFADEEDDVINATLAWIDHCLEMERMAVALWILARCDLLLE
jgi:hypothetical protein